MSVIESTQLNSNTTSASTTGHENIDITVTPAALAHIKKSMLKRGAGIGIRLNVKASGCSGKSYVVDYVDETNPNDLIIQLDKDVIICIEPAAYLMMKGTQIDYVKEGLNARFVFNNPNIKGACGCGESFYLD